ncbi:hypothetical protein P43SY_007793 [Pythium insidiosum]|uniref:SH3 domain-containing protein n=1 Tax=Pythium insidiosum TaxID=114742 RepID=A0AAD5Q7D3_PYTIN|nr:hypothetical protein P43SY_007793 [Pythium insidiosum]
MSRAHGERPRYRQSHAQEQEPDDEPDDERASWIMQVVALYDYEPEAPDELEFREGDALRVLRVQDDGWWQGFLVHAPRRVGVFPSNYVQIQSQRPAPQRQRQRAEETPRRRRIQQHYEQQQQQQKARDDSDAWTPRESARPSSVLELKRRLAEAERAQQKAEEARRQVRRQVLVVVAEPAADPAREREQAERQRTTRRRVVRWRDDEDEGELHDDDDYDNGDDDDGSYYTQQRWRRDVRQQEEEDEDEDDEEEEKEEESAFESFRDARRYEDEADEGEELQDEDEEEQPLSERRARKPSDDAQGAAASRIARGYRQHRQRAGRTAARQRHASGVIAHSIERHVERRRRETREREEEEERHRAAAKAIQNWMVRAHAVQRQQREKREAAALLSIAQQEDDAARLVQHWFRRRRVYFQWLEHVERERVWASRQREAAARGREQADAEADARRRKEQEDAAEERSRKEREHAERTIRPAAAAAGAAAVEHVPRDEPEHVVKEQTSAAPIPSKREKKRVMKKEAVDLVKALVQQQLNDRLREHDDKMRELQHLVTRLQDVIRQQNALIQDTTDHVLELELEPSRRSVGLRAAASALPAIAAPQPPAVRTSGLKPPRQLDRAATRLPLIAPAQSGSTPQRLNQPTAMRR